MSIEINQVFNYQSEQLNSVDDNKTIIRISSDGLTVFVKDKLNSVVYASAYRWPSNNKITIFLDAITQIKKEDLWLVNRQKNIYIIVDDLGYTFIPNELYNENEASIYLQQQIEQSKIEQEEIVVSKSKDVTGIYLVSKEAMKVQTVFDNAIVVSYSHALLELSQNIMPIKKQFVVLISFFDSYFDLIINKGEKLIYFNRYHYSTKEDFLYYLIVTLQNLKIENSDVEINLIGKIEPQSSLYELINRYFSDVYFFNSAQEYAWEYHRYCVEQNY